MSNKQSFSLKRVQLHIPCPCLDKVTSSTLEVISNIRSWKQIMTMDLRTLYLFELITNNQYGAVSKLICHLHLVMMSFMTILKSAGSKQWSAILYRQSDEDTIYCWSKSTMHELLMCFYQRKPILSYCLYVREIWFSIF